MPMYKLLALCLCFFILSANTQPKVGASQPETLTLKWNKAYRDETIQKATLGLEWTLSFVGAMLPNSPSGINIDSDKITINPNELGFNAQALVQIRKLHQKIRASDEYRKTGAVDLGRYVCLLIGSSGHYYELAGVPDRLEKILGNYSLNGATGYVSNSEISLGHRNIRFSQPEKLRQVFVASEIDSVTRAIHEYETIEILPNGQLRFGIFDSDGNRKNNADSHYTNAGKPAKCMWCHESKIQRMYRKQTDFATFMIAQELQNKLIGFNEQLEKDRAALTGGVAFSEKQQHTLSELLYISFMEPSAERLSLEWKMPLPQVQQLLSGLPTHVYGEFPFLGALYDRNAIEKLAPFKGLAVSASVREYSVSEVNHLLEP
jgi:hypothetical protein